MIDPILVLELRQYTLRSGARDDFVALFDAELAHTQQAVGIRVIGQFRDLDRPDAFVWLRGFPEMAARAEALGAFYFGPVWARHRERANSMMIDSDDVLLLEPAEAPRELAFPPDGVGRVHVDVWPVAAEDTDGLLADYRQVAVPALTAAGGRPLGALRTLHAVNNFPRLPVRDGERVVVTLTAFRDPADADRLLGDAAYLSATDRVARLATSAPQRLRLIPTPGSALGGREDAR